MFSLGIFWILLLPPMHSNMNNVPMFFFLFLLLQIVFCIACGLDCMFLLFFHLCIFAIINHLWIIQLKGINHRKIYGIKVYWCRSGKSNRLQWITYVQCEIEHLCLWVLHKSEGSASTPSRYKAQLVRGLIGVYCVVAVDEPPLFAKKLWRPQVLENKYNTPGLHED